MDLRCSVDASAPWPLLPDPVSNGSQDRLYLKVRTDDQAAGQTKAVPRWMVSRALLWQVRSTRCLASCPCILHLSARLAHFLPSLHIPAVWAVHLSLSIAGVLLLIGTGPTEPSCRKTPCATRLTQALTFHSPPSTPLLTVTLGRFLSFVAEKGPASPPGCSIELSGLLAKLLQLLIFVFCSLKARPGLHLHVFGARQLLRPGSLTVPSPSTDTHIHAPIQLTHSHTAPACL